MTRAQATEYAIKKARRSEVPWHVVECDHNDGKTCRAVAFDDDWLDSAEFEAFESRIVATVEPHGFVENHE